MSEELKTKVDVKGVDVEFFKKIVLENVLVEDQAQDTLFYADKLKVDISYFSFAQKRLDIDDIILLKSEIGIVKKQGEKNFNYQFITDLLAPKDTLKQDSSDTWKITLSAVTLINTRFIYKDNNDTSHTMGINYSDLDVKNINAKITDLSFKGLLEGQVQYLSLTEKSGFVLKDLSCKASVDSAKMQLAGLTISTFHSSIIVDTLEFKYQSFDDFNRFVEKVTIRSKFDRTKLDLNDMAYFAPALSGINRTISFQGDVHGKVSDLKLKNLDLFFGKYSEFHGNIDLTGLPNVEETFIHLNIKSLVTGKTDIEQIPIYPFYKKRTLSVPNNIGMLGLIKFKGNFTGFYNDFVTYGSFATSIGNVNSDVSMQRNNDNGIFAYHGKIKSADFNLGKFLFMSDYLGEITLNATIDGKGLNENAMGTFKGVINSIEINHYTYQNINVEGDLAKKIFGGLVSIDDNNIAMEFNGSIDFTGAVPNFDFKSTVTKANLNALNFTKIAGTSDISFTTEVRATGSNLDNLLGEINIKSLTYKRKEEAYVLENLNLVAINSNGKKILTLTSDIADGELDGDYNFSTLNQALKTLLSRYAPSYSEKETRRKADSKEEFKFRITTNSTSGITALFFPQLSISRNTSVEGEFNSKTNFIDLKVRSDQMVLFGTKIEKLAVDVSSSGSTIQTKATSKKITYSSNVWIDNLNVQSTTRNDSSIFTLDWEKDALEKRLSKINGTLLFEKNVARLKIKPSAIYISDSLWTIHDNNEIAIDSTRIEVRGMRLFNNNQQIKIQGVISKAKEDTLVLSLVNFNLTNINYFTKNASSLFNGVVSGHASISDIYKNPVFLSNFKFQKLYLNNELIGDGSLSSTWNPANDIINFNGTFTKGIVPNIEFNGFYHPSKKEDNINLELSMTAMRLQFFEEYIKDYCSDFKGQVSGKVLVKGSINQPSINGKLNVQAKKIKINYLNTVYSFSSDINIENNSFGVEGLKLYDQNGNSATVTGKLYHDNFKKFQLDFDINAKSFNCLNTTESLNSLYYGKAFVSGIINIFGPFQNLTFDANVKTEKGTQINIPLSGAQEIGENDFVTFVKKDTSSAKDNNGYKVRLDGMQLNFDLDVTPDAEVLLIFDSQSGDIMKGRGNGHIKMTINTLGNFNMYGDFAIESGDYLFTLKNIINKKFDIERGSTIRWSGDPYNAEINLSAVYRLKTSLSPLFPEDITGVYKKRYPVSCKLLLTDQLLKPTINFDIYLPTVDETTNQMAREVYEQKLNEHVFSLLVLNSFAQKDNGLSEAGASTSSELLSNQLSNMLSKVSNKFDLGVRYRPADQIVSQQVEVGVSTQLFNDRVSIDGSVGVAGTNPEQNNPGSSNQNTNNLVGDVNVEYKISKDGKLRAKAFNKSNDNTLGTSSGPFTQGAGLAYKEEFNTLNELYQRYLSKLKRNKKKD